MLKTSIQNSSFAVVASAFLSAVATCCLCISLDGTHLNPDTAQSLSVARNVLQGQGFSTSIIYYEEHYRLATWPAPQTVFPIGFPAMISALAALGVPMRTAAFLISIAGFLLVPPLIAAVALRMGRKPATALLLAALWLCFPMNWGNILESQADIIFTALTLGSLLLLQDPAPTMRQLLLSGLLAAAALSLRYAGVFWVMTVGVLFAAQIVQQKKLAGRQSAAFLIFPAVMMLLLFARNALLVGDLKGGNNNHFDKPFAAAMMEAWYAVSRITGLDQNGLMTGNIAEILVVAGGVSLLFCAALWIRRFRQSDLRPVGSCRVTGKTTVPIYIVVSTTVLIWLEATTSINLSPRMFFPLIPFALLCSADVAGRLLLSLSDSSAFTRRLTMLASGLVIAGLLAGQVRSAADVASQVHRFGLVTTIVDQSTESSQGVVVPRQLMADTSILTNEPHMLGETLERGVIGLTSAKYTSRAWTDEEVAALIHRYGVNQIVVFPDLPTTEENRFFRSVARSGEGHELPRPWLTPVLISSRIQIYTVSLSPPGCNCQRR